MLITPLHGAGRPLATQGLSAAAGAAPATGAFGQLVAHFIGQATVQEAQSAQAVRKLTMGQTDDLHNVLLAVAKADLSFRLVLEIRNRLTEAFQEIMRMQV